MCPHYQGRGDALHRMQVRKPWGRKNTRRTWKQKIAHRSKWLAEIPISVAVRQPRNSQPPRPASFGPANPCSTMPETTERYYPDFLLAFPATDDAASTPRPTRAVLGVMESIRRPIASRGGSGFGETPWANPSVWHTRREVCGCGCIILGAVSEANSKN
jgi:hypothetical protein